MLRFLDERRGFLDCIGFPGFQPTAPQHVQQSPTSSFPSLALPTKWIRLVSDILTQIACTTVTVRITEPAVRIVFLDT
jgi:hypothetical protein